MPLKVRAYELRRAPGREPLAYPGEQVAALRQQLAEARRVDARTRRLALDADLRQGRISTARGAVLRPWLVGVRTWAKGRYELSALRERRTSALRERRRSMDAPLDRFTTAYWQRTMGVRSWRRLDPHLWDWELAFGPLVDRLRPDLIHANDGRMLGVGARAKLRAGAEGRSIALVWDAHEFLPGRQILGAHPRWHAAACAHEAEHVRHADAVTTVSETMVDLLRTTYDLRVDIEIVRNAPTVGQGDSAEPGLRATLGLHDGVPLAIYIGAMATLRGVGIMVETLPRLPDLHVAFVARPSAFVDGLVARAAELGVADRLHVTPYVPVDRIVEFIASADVGVFPAHHVVNHDVDLPTKFYEYFQARLPMVVSDVRTTAETTQRLGCGEVFRAEDADDYVRAVSAVLDDPDRYRAAIDASGLLDEWTWEHQAHVLDAVYGRVLGR